MIKNMQTVFARSIIILAVMLCSLTQVHASPHDNLRLNGMATYWMMTSEAYIAALYVETPSSSAEQLLQSEQLKRMEMRVSAHRWRQRSFDREWRGAISNNNPAEVNEEFAEDILAWGAMPGGTLHAGDRILVDYTPGKSGVVHVNGVELLRFEKPEFFHVLLRTWIGDEPPYADFRRQILERRTPPSELNNRFAATVPDDPAARRAEVQGWLSGETAERRTQYGATGSGEVARNLYRLDVTRSILRHVIYPSRSLRARQEGTAVVVVTVNKEGDLLGHAIEESSGHQNLDNAAMQAIERATFSSFPDGIDEDELELLVPVRFTLP